MVPDVRHNLNRALRAGFDVGFPVYGKFPMAEFLTLVGFFVVLLFEEVTILAYEVHHSSLYLITSSMWLVNMSIFNVMQPIDDT